MIIIEMTGYKEAPLSIISSTREYKIQGPINNMMISRTVPNFEFIRFLQDSNCFQFTRLSAQRLYAACETEAQPKTAEVPACAGTSAVQNENLNSFYGHAISCGPNHQQPGSANREST